MSGKNGIIIGPWVGEFGWELFSWQGYCRAISKKYEKVIVISRPGNNFLYSDFCDIYLPFEPAEGTADSHMHSSVSDFNVVEFLKASVHADELANISWSWLGPTKIGNPPYDHWRASVNVSGFGDIVPEYKLYRGSPAPDNVDIVFHARNRQIRKNDNWSAERWVKLQREIESLGLTAASIGTERESTHVDGTLDYRGKSTSETCGLLRKASVIVGPSSGPMHLASLSGCPQVVWTSNPNQNFARYQYCWNPFNTDVSMLMCDDPSVEEVIEQIKKITNID